LKSHPKLASKGDHVKGLIVIVIIDDSVESTQRRCALASSLAVGHLIQHSRIAFARIFLERMLSRSVEKAQSSLALTLHASPTDID
jgi:hypothetical protein